MGRLAVPSAPSARVALRYDAEEYVQDVRLASSGAGPALRAASAAARAAAGVCADCAEGALESEAALAAALDAGAAAALARASASTLAEALMEAPPQVRGGGSSGSSGEGGCELLQYGPRTPMSTPLTAWPKGFPRHGTAIRPQCRIYPIKGETTLKHVWAFTTAEKVLL